MLDERRRSQGGNSFVDCNQLFLGNLPHSATEDDLREIFMEFGEILDLRIHSKPANKGLLGSRAPPNYGFITYETQQGVQNCLAAKVCVLIILQKMSQKESKTVSVELSVKNSKLLMNLEVKQKRRTLIPPQNKQTIRFRQTFFILFCYFGVHKCLFAYF